MSTTQVQIKSLTPGVPAADSVLIYETSDGLQTLRCKASEIAALSPVSSINGVTGAVSLNATSVGAAAASHGHTTGNISNFASEVVTIAASVAATAAPVLSVNGKTGAVSIGSGDVSSVNGLTGAVSLNATSIGAAPSSHTHTTGSIDNFSGAVVTIAAAVAATAAPVLSVNGQTGAVSISGGGGDVASINGLTGAVSLNATSVGAAPSTHGLAHARTGGDGVPIIIGTIAALTQDENAVDIGGYDLVYMSAATTDREIRGFTGGTTGWPVMVVNGGTTYNLIVKHAHTSAATSSQNDVPWQGDYVVPPRGALLRMYDTTISRNRIL